MTDQKKSKEALDYNVKPVKMNPPIKGLYQLNLHSLAVCCPFQTVQGVYDIGGQTPKAFIKQNCTTECPHARLEQDADGKHYWVITCSGERVRREVDLMDDSKIISVSMPITAP